MKYNFCFLFLGILLSISVGCKVKQQDTEFNERDIDAEFGTIKVLLPDYLNNYSIDTLVEDMPTKTVLHRFNSQDESKRFSVSYAHGVTTLNGINKPLQQQLTEGQNQLNRKTNWLRNEIIQLNGHEVLVMEFTAISKFVEIYNLKMQLVHKEQMVKISFQGINKDIKNIREDSNRVLNSITIE